MTLNSLTLSIAAGAFLLTATHSFAQEEIRERNLRMAMAVNTESPWTQAAQHFADAVAEASGGKMKITVFPDGQLSNGNQVAEFELLQNGSIDFTYHSSIILSGLDQRFALFSMPWIAPSDEALFALMDGAGAEVWQGVEALGVKSLGGFSTSGFRQLTNSVRPVSKPEDLQGLTLRVPGLKLYQDIFNAFGVSPVPTSFGELYGALQQGVVNGQENPISLIYVSRFAEVQDYMTVWNYSADSISVLTNLALWDSLNEAERAILMEAADDAGDWHRAEQTAANARLVDELAKEMDVIKLTPEQVQAFKDTMKPIYDEWSGIIGAELLEAAQGK
jgi:tripartite ATP-independent transporter DctP family solute receptor